MLERGGVFGQMRSQVWRKEDEVKVEAKVFPLMKRNFISEEEA